MFDRMTRCFYDRYSFLYLLRPGGKSFSNFLAPLFSLSWFFSCFLLGSIACWAAPIQTSFFAAGSYMPTTKVPMLMVEVLAENATEPPPHGPQPRPTGPRRPTGSSCPSCRRSRLSASPYRSRADNQGVNRLYCHPPPW